MPKAANIAGVLSLIFLPAVTPCVALAAAPSNGSAFFETRIIPLLVTDFRPTNVHGKVIHDLIA